MKEKRKLQFGFIPHPSSLPLLAVFVAMVVASAARGQYGPVLAGTGAVNRSFGGVAVAAPLSSAGAMLWNPATLPGLKQSELEIGAELLFANTRLGSRVPAGALGAGTPPVPLAGAENSDRGVFALPTVGLAYHPEGSPFSFGLGIFAQAGFGLDYPGSTTDPLLTPPPPNGIGVGPIHSDYQVLQITPAVAYQLTDRLSVAAGPILDLATLLIDPAFFAAPDDANGDGFATFPTGSHTQTTWGGGFIVGTYYRADTWGLGASIKSPQWFDTFRFNSRDELGRPRDLRFGLDLPMILSVGASYTGWERWVLAADLRYLDFANANGFGDKGFTPEGAVGGAGWRNIFALALGAQYQMTDALSLRAGYTWNENPIPNSQTSFNLAVPTIIQNTLYAGASWQVTEDFALSLAYIHGFENSIQGPLVFPAGAVLGTSVRSSAAVNSAVLGATVKFGCSRRQAPEMTSEQ
jgi:long-chain fatty acid transport protein